MKQSLLAGSTAILSLFWNAQICAQTVIRVKGFYDASIENRCMAIDAQNNIYFGGSSGDDSLHFDYYHLGAISISEQEVGYVMKLGSDLDLQWARPIQGQFRSECNGMVIDSSGGVVGSVPVVNWVEGADTIPGGDGFARINPSGVLTEYVNADVHDGYRIYNGENGTIYALKQNNPIWMMRKFDAQGNVLMELPTTTNGNAEIVPLDMERDSDGNFYIGGYYHSDSNGTVSLEIDGVSLPTVIDDEYIGILLKYNANGALQWVRFIDASMSSIMDWVEYDNINDRVLVAGGFRDWILDENQDTIFSQGSDDIMVCSYSPTGNLIRTVISGENGTNGQLVPIERALQMKVNSDADIYVATGGSLIKYDSDLNIKWIKDIDVSIERGGMELDTAEDIIVCGFLSVGSNDPAVLDSLYIELYDTDPSQNSTNNIFTIAKITDDNSLKSISGKVYVDEDNNGVYDQGEHLVQNNMVSGSGLNTSHTGQTGNFAFYTSEGTYSFTASEPNYYTLIPDQRTVTLDSAVAGAFNQDFRLVANGQLKDLKVTVGAFGAFIPGFGNSYNITVTNLGTVQTNGTLEFELSDDLNLISATPNYDQLNGNILSWDIQNIQPFDQRTYRVQVEVPALTILGDTIVSTASCAVDGQDEYMSNNSFVSSEIVVGSYDPNDKRVLPEGDLQPADLSNSLQYTIRFQNTGTYPAQIVRIMDTLSTALDLSTVQTIGASHDFLEFRRVGNVLEWLFPDINLPDSTADYEGSQGFVTFTVMPNSGVGVSDVISNQAAIYFDFNEPVITNEVEQMVVTGIAEFNLARDVLNVFPNPFTTRAQVSYQTPQGTRPVLQLTDMLGRMVQTVQLPHNEGTYTIEAAGLGTGVYFCTLLQGAEVLATQKLSVMEHK